MAKNRTVLFVDDEPAWALYFRTILEEVDIEFKFVNSVEAALKVIRGEGCALVLADTNLPRVDGLQLLSTLRVELPHLPVIFLFSAYRFGDMTRETILARGARAVLSKEEALSNLAELVRGILNLP